ncbi:family 15 glycoside hydrolase, partial [Blyttiomyces helicus]
PLQVIHVLPDEIIRNYTTLHSALPRESASKEIDAAILSVISFPAFAVVDPRVIESTRNDIVKKLGGQYGMKRFLRDGHQTALEDTSRLHYDPHELNIFAGIESEWPLFFTYMILDGLFREDYAQVAEYRAKLEPLLVDSDTISNFSKRSGSPDAAYPPVMRLVPELFKVPRESVDGEKNAPGSQIRTPNENVPLVWAQSLYILGNLIHDNLLSPAELDPLGRRLAPLQYREDPGVVIQVVLLAESEELREKLLMFGLDTQTTQSCEPITISQPVVLRDAFAALGESQKLGLTGRPKRPIGTLSTCKLYRCQGRLYAFLPHFMDREEFYLVSDNDYLVSSFEQQLLFVRNHWTGSGRPTFTVMLTKAMMGDLLSTSDRSSGGNKRLGRSGSGKRSMLNFMMSLRSGMCGGTRVRLGRLSDMVNTACIESLDFLNTSERAVDNDWHPLLTGAASIAASTSSAKSPLTGAFFSDEPTDEDASALDGFKLQDHVEDAPSMLSYAPDVPASVPHVATPGGGPRAPHVSTATAASPAVPVSYPATPREPQRRSTYLFDMGTSTGLELTLSDPTHLTPAIALLKTSTNLYDQVEILHYLQSCLGLDGQVDSLGTVSSLLEEVYAKSMHLRQWSVVRQAAGILRKIVNSLTINVSDLLIRQTPVTVGWGAQELFINAPMGPMVLQETIYERCSSDIREAPLVQEVLTCLGNLIRSNLSLFEGIMRVRTHFYIIAMREEISRARGCDEEEAVEVLMGVSWLPAVDCGA